MANSPKTIAYIDGFNFYYGAVKGTRFKWLDFDALWRQLLPNNNIVKIKYFTALVNELPHDRDAPNRQRRFLDALPAHSPKIEVHLGHFLSQKVSLPLADRPGFARVIKTEEKGSDVNLAVHLINDAWRNEFDVALVFSNDSDLAGAIKMVRDEHGKAVGIVNPHALRGRRSSQELKNVSTFERHLRKRHLRTCQMPNPIPGTNLQKPRDW